MDFLFELRCLGLLAVLTCCPQLALREAIRGGGYPFKVYILLEMLS